MIEKLKMDYIDLIRHELERCAHFNEGRGLILTPTLARKLKDRGIDGPYTVQEDIPKVEKKGLQVLL
jgi:hypothetical protein